MPVAPGASNNSNNQSRPTFRPPWVKDGPPPMPMPSQPWVKANKTFPPNENKQEAPPPVGRPSVANLRKVSDTPPPAPPTERKTSKITITPSQPKENGALKNPNPEPPRRNFEPVKREADIAPKPPKPTEKRASEVTIPIERPETKTTDKPVERQSSKARVLERQKTSDKYEGLPGPPKPPAPPMPPAPPPPPPQEPLIKSTLTPEKAKKLEALRSRPKKRPDWGNVMKEIESGRKLAHVKTNDRSAPLLPKVKAKGQFVYESERPNLHNQLLKQIESGVRLKPTKTNDRSKPFIEGLRKFRRQMTIEEQIQKSASMASMGILEPEPDPLDEVDDIDKVRDDLQSTKQLLAMELKNKESLERENKKLMTRILNLEVDIEKERNKVNKGASVDSNELQKELKTLREEAEKAKKIADEMETKYHDIQGQYDLLKLDLEDASQKNQRLEKQLKVAQAANLANLQGQGQGQPLTKQPSKKIIHQNKVHETPIAPDSPEETEEETETESETESEADGEDEEAQKERRLLREVKLLTTKLRSFKTKRETAKKERKALKEQMNKLQKAIKEEKKKYKVLQKEVDKMSKLMNEDDEEEIEDEEDVDDEEEEEESTEEEEETEESESEESEGDLPESAPPEKKKVNLQGRTKKYENLLSSLKKGNYLLKANVDRYKDELNKQKEMALTLQEDLNSVLAELG